MSTVFKRGFHEVLIAFKSKQNDEIPGTEQSNQFELKIQECLNNYINDIEIKEEGTENDLLLKLNKAKKLEEILCKEFEKNAKLKSKVGSMKLCDNDIRDKIVENKTKLLRLQEELICAEKAHSTEKEDFISSHKTNLFLYKLYKKYSGCKLQLESSNVVTLEFAQGFYVKLQSENWRSNWNLIDIKPEVINRSVIEKRLYETDDVQGLLASVFKAYGPLLKQCSSSK